MIVNGICERLDCWNTPICWHPDIYRYRNCNFLIWFNQDVIENRLPWYDADIIENIDIDVESIRAYSKYILTVSKLKNGIF